MEPIYPKEGSQEHKVLTNLLNADGAWINKQFFVRTLYLTQAGRAIYMLENKYRWPIEHSDFTDEWGFKSYRIVVPKPREQERVVI